MKTHTPGPWSVNVWTTGRRTVETERGLVIAEVHQVHEEAGIALNARVLAAAPDMLEALEAFPLAAFDKDPDTLDAAEFVDASAEFLRAMAKARAAIVKAKGGAE